ncbi:MAG TPA: hypothetical protein VFT19_02515 [Solirubrobacterales bacterium]|nr:hypothetical protein [Solirubrobacterales bacterium]
MPTPNAKPRVAIATYAGRTPLRSDDLPLLAELEARGISPAPLVWDDGDSDWSGFDACLIRSVSDYNEKYEAFSRWVEEVGDRVTLWNSPAMTMWNAEKHYLRDLARNGVPTIPTVWLEPGDETELDEVLSSRGWDDAIVKPVIGLGARLLHRVCRKEGGRRQLNELLEHHAVLVQPFLRSVPEQGETSLVYIDGRLSHTVRKRPASGDFRVQKERGGTSERCEPTPAERSVAELAITTLDSTPMHARVDLVAGDDGAPLLIELELIEPDLFLRHEPEAAGRLAQAMASRLSSVSGEELDPLNL